MQREGADFITREPRHKVNIVAVIRREHGKPFRSSITELSYQGCQAIDEELLAVGERVAIVLPGMGEVLAQVRWTADRTTGYRFLTQERVVDRMPVELMPT